MCYLCNSNILKFLLLLFVFIICTCNFKSIINPFMKKSKQFSTLYNTKFVLFCCYYKRQLKKKKNYIF